MANRLDECITDMITSSCVRIKTASGEIVGTGFLINPDTIVTCAHVIISAWKGLDENETKNLTPPVYIDFPFLEPGKDVTAKVTSFKGIKDDTDLACLKIDSSKPAGANHPPLKVSKDYWGHKFRAFGFPTRVDTGQWATGEIRAKKRS